MADDFNMAIMRGLEPSALAIASFTAGVTNPANLLSDQPGDRMGMTGGEKYVVIDCGAPVSVNMLAVLYTDFAVGEGIQLYGSNVDATFSSAANYSDLGRVNITAGADMWPDPGYRHILFNFLFGPKLFRWLRVGFMIGGTARSVGRIVLGNALQVDCNPDYGSTSWGFEEAPEPDTLDSGVEILEELPVRPYFEFSIAWASEAEMETWWNGVLGELQWKRKPVLVVRRPDLYAYRQTGIFWGILRLQPFAAASFDTFEVSGKIRSMV